MDNKIEYTEGSGNVFADLGLPNPEERLIKAEVAFRINSIIEKRSPTQVEAAKLLGCGQPKISALKHGQLRGFSLERLFTFMLKLDRDIKIVVKRKPRSQFLGRISLTT